MNCHFINQIYCQQQIAEKCTGAYVMCNRRRQTLNIVAFLLVLTVASLCVEVHASVNPPADLCG